MSWAGFVYTWTTITIWVDAFITTYWAYLLIAVCLGVFAYTRPAKTKQLLSGLMLMAERKAMEMALETGQAKMDFVVEQAYNILPPVARLFISKEALRIMAQKLFDEAKEKVKTITDPDLPEFDEQTPTEPEEPPNK